MESKLAFCDLQSYIEMEKHWFLSIFWHIFFAYGTEGPFATKNLKKLIVIQTAKQNLIISRSLSKLKTVDILCGFKPYLDLWALLLHRNCVRLFIFILFPISVKLTIN